LESIEFYLILDILEDIMEILEYLGIGKIYMLSNILGLNGITENSIHRQHQ